MTTEDRRVALFVGLSDTLKNLISTSINIYCIILITSLNVWDIAEYCVTFHVRNKTTSLNWNLKYDVRFLGRYFETPTFLLMITGVLLQVFVASVLQPGKEGSSSTETCGGSSWSAELGRVSIGTPMRTPSVDCNFLNWTSSSERGRGRGEGCCWVRLFLQICLTSTEQSSL